MDHVKIKQVIKAVLSGICLIAAAILAYNSNSYAWLFVMMAVIFAG